jgi:hypothetical protein
MNIINGSTYCTRCGQLSCIGDDGLCEDCRELIALREKVLVKQSRIDALEAENKEQNGTISRLLEKATAQSEHVQKEWLSPYEAAQLKADVKRLREALEDIKAQLPFVCKPNYNGTIYDCVLAITESALNDSASGGKTLKIKGGDKSD